MIADVGQGAVRGDQRRARRQLRLAVLRGQRAGPRADPRCATWHRRARSSRRRTAADDGFCSITGGYVVRDPGLPTLLGRYVYGDFCNAALRSVDLDTPTTDAAIGLNVSSLSSFGEDACGRLLVVSLNGPVSRMTDGPSTPCEPEADRRRPRRPRRPRRRRPTVTPARPRRPTRAPRPTPSATPRPERHARPHRLRHRDGHARGPAERRDAHPHPGPGPVRGLDARHRPVLPRPASASCPSPCAPTRRAGSPSAPRASRARP